MPSPVGHALAGYAAGAFIAGHASQSGSLIDRIPARIVLFAGLACLPDIDFVFRRHSMYTHSTGAVLAVAVVSAIFLRPAWAMVAACAAAYGSHMLLDWLGQDTSAPIGIMALWPFSGRYYQAPVPIFIPVSRRYSLPNFWTHNLYVVSIEILVFGTLALAAHWTRGRINGQWAQQAAEKSRPDGKW
jgi:hypothetical protein